MEGDEDDKGFSQAYAKLTGTDLVYYIRKLHVTIGRGNRGQGVADVLISSDVVISRLHAEISYSIAEQCFELRVLGKNGVYVDGRFVTRSDAPAELRSQSEIILGKAHPAELTFLLPVVSVLPVRVGRAGDAAAASSSATARSVSNVQTTSRARAAGHTDSAADSHRLVDLIGESLADAVEASLSVEALVNVLWSEHQDELSEPLRQSQTVLENATRHVLALSPYFYVVQAAEKVEGNALWAIHPVHANRFALPRVEPRRDLRRARPLDAHRSTGEHNDKRLRVQP